MRRTSCKTLDVALSHLVQWLSVLRVVFLVSLKTCWQLCCQPEELEFKVRGNNVVGIIVIVSSAYAGRNTEGLVWKSAFEKTTKMLYVCSFPFVHKKAHRAKQAHASSTRNHWKKICWVYHKEIESGVARTSGMIFMTMGDTTLKSSNMIFFFSSKLWYVFGLLVNNKKVERRRYKLLNDDIFSSVSLFRRSNFSLGSRSFFMDVNHTFMHKGTKRDTYLVCVGSKKHQLNLPFFHHYSFY